MCNWLFGSAVTTTLAFIGLYLQFLVKQANQIKLHRLRLALRCLLNRLKRGWVRSLPPKLHRYECCQAFLVFDAVRELLVDDVQIGWFAAPSARDAALQLAKLFPIDTTDLAPASGDGEAAWHEMFAYTSASYWVWARPMSRRAARCGSSLAGGRDWR